MSSKPKRSPFLFRRFLAALAIFCLVSDTVFSVSDTDSAFPPSALRAMSSEGTPRSGLEEALTGLEEDKKRHAVLIPELILRNPGHPKDDLPVTRPAASSLTVLVTGGLGFMGSNFIRYMLMVHPTYRFIILDNQTVVNQVDNMKDVFESPLVQKVKLVKGDIADGKLLRELLQGSDAVVHFAAESSVDRSYIDDARFIGTNVIGTRQLLDALQEEMVRRSKGPHLHTPIKLIHISTDEVYGSASLRLKRPFTENSPLRPNNNYAVTKAQADEMVQSFNSKGGRAVILRPTNNYGPSKYPEAFIPLAVIHHLLGLPIPVHGKGEAERNWLSVWDMARAVDVALHRAQPGQIYNVSGGNPMRNLDLVQTLLDEMGVPSEKSVRAQAIRFMPPRKGYDLRYVLDDSKFRSEVGWQPIVPFQEGVRDLIRWYTLHARWWLGVLESHEYQTYYERIYGTEALLELNRKLAETKGHSLTGLEEGSTGEQGIADEEIVAAVKRKLTDQEVEIGLQYLERAHGLGKNKLRTLGQGAIHSWFTYEMRLEDAANYLSRELEVLPSVSLAKKVLIAARLAGKLGAKHPSLLEENRMDEVGGWMETYLSESKMVVQEAKPLQLEQLMKKGISGHEAILILAEADVLMDRLLPEGFKPRGGFTPVTAAEEAAKLRTHTGLEEPKGPMVGRRDFLKFLGAAIASGEQTIQEFGKLAERHVALPPSFEPHRDSLLTFVRENEWVDPLFRLRKSSLPHAKPPYDESERIKVRSRAEMGYILKQKEAVLEMAPGIIGQQQESMKRALSRGKNTLAALDSPEERKPLLEGVRQQVPNLSGIPDDQLAQGLVWAVKKEIREAQRDYSWIVKDWHRYSGQLEQAIAQEIESQAVVEERQGEIRERLQGIQAQRAAAPNYGRAMVLWYEAAPAILLLDRLEGNPKEWPAVVALVDRKEDKEDLVGLAQNHSEEIQDRIVAVEEYEDNLVKAKEAIDAKLDSLGFVKGSDPLYRVDFYTLDLQDMRLLLRHLKSVGIEVISGESELWEAVSLAQNL